MLLGSHLGYRLVLTTQNASSLVASLKWVPHVNSDSVRRSVANEAYPVFGKGDDQLT